MTMTLRKIVFQIVSVALVSLGFMQVSFAGTIGTGQLLEQQAGSAALAELDRVLERDDVAQKLVALGVDADQVRERAASLGPAELAEFNDRLEAGMAGGDAIGVIGVVFLVLLILELVGVTNVFTKI